MVNFDDYFSFQVFLIIFRETLETAIIVSVLLSFIKQSLRTKAASDRRDYGTELQREQIAGTSDGTGLVETEPVIEVVDGDSAILIDEFASSKLYNKLRFQIWAGAVAGLILCMLLGSIIISIFYVIGSDLWSLTEHYWEGCFSLLASVVISVMGVKILRVNKMQDKWKWKLNSLLSDQNIFNRAIRTEGQTGSEISVLGDELVLSTKHKNWKQKVSAFGDKYSMFILPFITTLREGMEAVVFIGGVNLSQPLSSITLSLIMALAAGSSIGIILYRSGNSLSLQYFLIASTCFLYLVAAGLFSKGFWNLELQDFINKCGGQDVSETGSGPGSYDIFQSVWHVNCCNGETDGGWVMFSAILGWTNSATYGSVLSYNFFWIAVIAILKMLVFEEKNGYLPLIPISWQKKRIYKRVSINKAIAFTNSKNSNNISRESVDSHTPLNSAY